MKCTDCREEILQKHPEKCPYCGSTNLISEEDNAQNVIAEIKKLQKAGRHEEVALRYEELAMWDEAEECRRMEKGSHVDSANVKVGRISAISMECPHCGSTQSLSQKSNEVVCENCRKNYIIPKKVLDLL
jgi:DNA-directed RNA polymerase subunit RPC12/RpoP